MKFQITPFKSSSNIKISGFNGLPKEQNLIYKATQLLSPWIKKPSDVYITVEKKIPQGGGMGGGSSNAATTLNVLNEVWDCGLSNLELMDMGLSLGADVPVFIGGHDALATGIGEQLEKIRLPKQNILLLFPDCSVPTAEVFKDEHLKRDQIPVSTQDAILVENWINDCLPVVLNKYPEVKRVHDVMSQHFRVYLSGTGSTMFVILEDCESLVKAKKMAQTICSCHCINS